jgi:serine/threonine protein kinase
MGFFSTAIICENFPQRKIQIRRFNIPIFTDDVYLLVHNSERGVLCSGGGTVPFTSGDIIAERYQLQTRLGINGVRETWLIQDLQQTGNWVLKLLYFGGDTHWQDLKLMEREAKTLQALQNPGIPRYSDAFWTERPEGNYFCLLQQYIPGINLAEQLQRGERYDPEKRERLTRAMLDILQYLHAQSPPVVHRDIKPSNILVGDDGRFYLIDFGAVQAQVTGRGTMTVVGTFGYMPPEQFLAQSVPASDLYALGATLLNLATGIDPAEMPRKGMKILFSPDLNLDQGWQRWLGWLLEPDLEQRFSTASQALKEFENRHGIPVIEARQDPLIAKPPKPSLFVVLIAGFGYSFLGGFAFVISGALALAVNSFNPSLGFFVFVMTCSALVGALFITARENW